VALLEASAAGGEEDLLERVARYFGVAVAEMEGRGRSPRLNDARAVAIAGLQQRGYSLVRIAALFDGRDKSTISSLASRGKGLVESQDILRHLLAG
jgi:chromosomal replication initiation ATPase DnaA